MHARRTGLLRQAGLQVSSGARTGAVTLIQRFGSALNLNMVRPARAVESDPTAVEMVRAVEKQHVQVDTPN